MPPSKEDFLERKILCLEKRLTHVERFVEARFSEFLQDYATPTESYRQRPPPPPKPTSSITPTRASHPNRPAPASVKRKAEQVGDHPKPRKDADNRMDPEGYKNCVVHIVRLDYPEVEKKFRPSSSAASTSTPTPTAGQSSASIASSRTRRTRTPVVKEGFINYSTSRSRRKEDRGGVDDGGNEEANENVKTTAQGSFDNENEDDNGHQQDDCDYDNEMGDDGGGCGYDSGPPSPIAVQDMVEVHIHEDDDSRRQKGAENQEEEEEYFTLPGILRPIKTERISRGGGNTLRNQGGGDGESEDEEVEAGDPLDNDWSGAEDNDNEEDDEDNFKVKNSHKRKPDSTRPKRAPPRKRLPDGTLPRKDNRSVKLDHLRMGSITLKHPTKKECPFCHKHFNLEMINLHIETHTKERHLRCTYPNCDKSFYSSGAFSTHKRTHETEKGHNCRLCDKFFPRSDKCLDHERGCAKRAAQRGEIVDSQIIEDLKRRTKGKWRWVEPTPIKTNALGEEEKKVCPHCNITLKVSWFEKHLKKHESGVKWSCTECDKTYLEKTGLLKHINTAHINLVHQNEKEAEPAEGGVGVNTEEAEEGVVEEVNVKHVIVDDIDGDANPVTGGVKDA